MHQQTSGEKEISQQISFHGLHEAVLFILAEFSLGNLFAKSIPRICENFSSEKLFCRPTKADIHEQTWQIGRNVVEGKGFKIRCFASLLISIIN
jgi:hypothetical protein